MNETPMDQASFERLLGCQVTPSQFAAVSAAGAMLYIALHRIEQETRKSQAPGLTINNIQAIASSAFVKALN